MKGKQDIQDDKLNQKNIKKISWFKEPGIDYKRNLEKRLLLQIFSSSLDICSAHVDKDWTEEHL